MSSENKRITDAELDVLRLLWDEEPRTARGIAGVLYESTTSSSIGTVQKLLQRLEAKKCVRRDGSEHIHRFYANVSQTELAGQQLQLLAAKLSDGSLAPFVSHLVESKRLSKKEKDAIKRLLE